MHILLLRHGIAADIGQGGTRSDEERPLTEEGNAVLERACRTYARLAGPIDRIVSSPLLRARQTADLFADALGDAPEREVSELLTPSSRPTAVLDLLQGEAWVNVGAIALVGHEPHLGSLLGLLLTGSERYSVPLGKGMLARVRVDEPRSMLGSLELCLTQRAAAAEAGPVG